MKKQVFTISVSVAIALCVIGAFSFRSPAPDGNSHPAYMYKQITTIESVIPGGLGRSRILSTDDNGQVLEKDLKNFYSLVGINFDNIANNDRVIVDRLNEYSDQGWELLSVTTGSNQQSSGGSSSGGLFISRYIFRKAK